MKHAEDYKNVFFGIEAIMAEAQPPGRTTQSQLLGDGWNQAGGNKSLEGEEADD